MGRAVQTAIDSLNFFVESRNAGNVLSATTTATGGITSPDLVNTDQRGAMFFITIASLTVSAATLALNINAKDVQTSTYFPYLRASLDGLTASSSLQYMVMLYVGAVSTSNVAGPGAPGTAWGPSSSAGVGTNQMIPMPVPGTFQVVSSLTITNTTATTNSGSISYSVDYAKVM